jgi:tetratricopeptide (TPR) repeat protein
VALDPNSAMVLDFLGFALRFGDRPNDSIPVIQKSLRLDPFARSNTIFSLGFSYLYAGRYEEAIPPCQKAIARDPDNLGAHLCLAYAYIATDRDDEARLIANEILRIETNFSVEYFSKTYPHKNKTVQQEFMSALRKAGLK